jgi:hypothetical protein
MRESWFKENSNQIGIWSEIILASFGTEILVKEILLYQFYLEVL